MSKMVQLRRNNDLTESDLTGFISVIRDGLKLGLGSISLQLIDLALYHQPDKLVLMPNTTAWSLRAIVANPLTQQVKESRTNFQGEIGDTDVESVRPMVADIVDKMRMEFYGTL